MKSIFVVAMADFNISAHGFAFAKLLNQKNNSELVVLEDLSTLFRSKESREIFGKKTYITVSRVLLFISAIRYLFLLVTLRTSKNILSFRYGGELIGEHLYDALLRRYSIPTVKKLNFRQIFFCYVSFVFALETAKKIKRMNIGRIYIQDNTYRQGLMLDILKIFYSCELVSPLGYGTFTASIQPLEVHSHQTLRHINVEQFKKFQKSVDRTNIDTFLAKRFSGQGIDRDSKMAHAKKDTGSIIAARSAERIAVLVACHVFSDAPHAYARSVYGDYTHWFKAVVTSLSQSGLVDIYVKPHPSRSLYNEGNVVEKLLEELNIENIRLGNFSHLLYSEDIDYVVTNGGTIGMEAAALGIPVISSSFSPYSDLGFSEHYKSAPAFEKRLAGLSSTHRLDAKQIEDAGFALYYFYKHTAWDWADFSDTALEFGIDARDVEATLETKEAALSDIKNMMGGEFGINLAAKIEYISDSDIIMYGSLERDV